MINQLSKKTLFSFPPFFRFFFSQGGRRLGRVRKLRINGGQNSTPLCVCVCVERKNGFAFFKFCQC